MSNCAQNFSPPYPIDYQAYCTTLVAGLSFRKNDAWKFIGGIDKELKFERELNNKHDKDAIKVIGVSNLGCSFIGYVPKELAAQIRRSGLMDKVKPALDRIFFTSTSFIEIRFKVIGLKSDKRKFDGWLDNKLASKSQKEFYKFFDIPIPKKLTNKDARNTFRETYKRLKEEGSERLKEYNAYESIIDDFDDKYFRLDYEIKKPTRDMLIEILDTFIREGKSYQSLNRNIDIVVDRFKAFHPKYDKNYYK